MDKKTIVSHTIVRDGMPFIGLVLQQVLPYMNRCLITISEKSIDNTLQILRKLEKQHPHKIKIYFENVSMPGLLTKERQKQVSRSYEDWILFLDDDDFWSEESLEEMIELLDTDKDALANNPYQVIDRHHYDHSWRFKWFTKWFKNQEGINYRKQWPKDLIYLNDDMLYWRNQNKRTIRVKPRYFHLSNIKPNSFRDKKWAKKFKSDTGSGIEYPEEVKKHIWRIYDELNK